MSRPGCASKSLPPTRARPQQSDPRSLPCFGRARPGSFRYRVRSFLRIRRARLLTSIVSPGARFRELDKGSSIAGHSGAIEMLMRAGFDTSAEWDSQEAHAAWRLMEKEFGFGPLMDWTVRHLRAARSDVPSLPTPIIRKDAETVAHAMHVGMQMVPLARRVPHFTMQGLHLLIHAEIFDADPRAEEARKALVREVAAPATTGMSQGLFLSVKLYDPNNLLSDPDRGRIARTNLSEMLVGLQEGARRADGVLAAFNAGNRTLGFLDSGVDLVGVRLTGRTAIDRIIKGRTGDRGARNVPPITLPRSMVDEDPARVRRVYSATGAFPVPTCLQPEPYWDYPWGEAVKYTARAKCGVFVELATEYRDAAKDTAKPLREAVASRVRDAGNRQELDGSLSFGLRGGRRMTERRRSLRGKEKDRVAETYHCRGTPNARRTSPLGNTPWSFARGRGGRSSRNTRTPTKSWT